MSSPGEEGDGQIRRAQLLTQFHGTRKGDFKTIEAYVKSLKSIANSLEEIGSPISDSDMVRQLLAGLPLPKFEEACSMEYMQEDMLLQDHGEQVTTDPDVVDQEQSSAFCNGDKFSAVLTVAGVLGAVAAVSAFPTVVGAVGAASASRMIVVGAVSGMTVVAGWKIWQAQPRKWD